MSELPENAFQPVKGILGQRISENPGAGQEPGLRFYVELRFVPFDYEDETLNPLFRIDSIEVPAKSWRDLENQSFSFPWAPKPGSVEAAMLLFGEHNPADVTLVQFGKVEEGTIELSFETEVDFEMEADRDDLEQMELSFSLPLEIDPLQIATSMEKRCQGDPDQIREAVAPLVDLDAYGSIEKVPGGFVFPVN